MTTIDGRQVIPASDLPRRAAGANDSIVGVVRAGTMLAAFPVAELPVSPAIQARIDALAASQQAGGIAESSWARLVSMEPGISAPIGTPAEISPETDPGSHVDPIKAGEQVVPNAGRFVRRTAAANGWEWLSANLLSEKADRSALEKTDADVSGLKSSMDVDTVVPAGALPWLEGGYTVAFDQALVLRLVSESTRAGSVTYASNPVASAEGSRQAVNSLGFEGELPLPPWDWLPKGIWGAYDEQGELRVMFENGAFLGMGDVSSVTAEVIGARGAVPSLEDRITAVIDPYGLPTYGLHFPEYLRQVRSRLQRLRNGEAVQCDIALGPGDSWTFVRSYWSENFAKALVERYGDGGGGWVGFGWPQAGSVGNGNARGSLYGYDATASVAQGWTCGYASTATIDASPDGCMVTSNGTAGKVLTGTYPSSPSLSGGRLFYRGYGDNPVITFSWNGEAAMQLTLSGTGVFAIDIPAPVAPGAGSWTITTVSGTARLFGLNLLSAAKGVRIHKLAASGSASFGWGNTSATFGDRLRAGFGLLSPHVIAVMLGVNDSKSGRTVEQYTSNMTALIANLRAGAPAADIMLVSQPEISNPGTVALAGYRQALKRLAYQNRCAYLDLQPAFGPIPVDYGPSGVVPLLVDDGIHPNNGGSAVVQAAFNNVFGV